MDPVDLEGVFPSGELCRITLRTEALEVNTGYMRFTPSALILRGVWHPITAEGDTEDTHPVIGARAIPWREVRSIDSSTPPSGYGRQDIDGVLAEYGVHPDERPMYAHQAQ
ncbi:hypothetical protein [Streptomyces sp. NPDC012450]|uniref:hypothetical protein n=1 Tax=Streptomyces sp. NPDC012450 TaxID=3364834 RepID=UPI0036EBDFB1